MTNQCILNANIPLSFFGDDSMTGSDQFYRFRYLLRQSAIFEPGVDIDNFETEHDLFQMIRHTYALCDSHGNIRKVPFSLVVMQGSEKKRPVLVDIDDGKFHKLPPKCSSVLAFWVQRTTDADKLRLIVFGTKIEHTLTLFSDMHYDACGETPTYQRAGYIFPAFSEPAMEDVLKEFFDERLIGRLDTDALIYLQTTAFDSYLERLERFSGSQDDITAPVELLIGPSQDAYCLVKQVDEEGVITWDTDRFTSIEADYRFHINVVGGVAFFTLIPTLTQTIFWEPGKDEPLSDVIAAWLFDRGYTNLDYVGVKTIACAMREKVLAEMAKYHETDELTAFGMTMMAHLYTFSSGLSDYNWRVSLDAQDVPVKARVHLTHKLLITWSWTKDGTWTINFAVEGLGCNIPLLGMGHMNECYVNYDLAFYQPDITVNIATQHDGPKGEIRNDAMCRCEIAD